jgi:hypothetical protein
MIDVGSTSITARNIDKKVQSDEWNTHLSAVSEAGKVWANFVRFQNPKESDFDEMDVNGRGEVTFEEFCTWISKAEIQMETELGQDLKISQEIDRGTISPKRGIRHADSFAQSVAFSSIEIKEDKLKS